MKPAEIKREYVRLRAEGMSQSAVAEKLHISKSTCSKWDQDLAGQIDEYKRAQLHELCESYGMGKEARIKNLGETLKKINDALERADFSDMDPAKLLDFKLKYTGALREEYAGTKAAIDLTGKGVTAEQIMEAVADLLNRARAGEITTEQAQKEGAILSQLLKAFDQVEIQTKLDKMEAILGGQE